MTSLTKCKGSFSLWITNTCWKEKRRLEIYQNLNINTSGYGAAQEQTFYTT